MPQLLIEEDGQSIRVIQPGAVIHGDVYTYVVRVLGDDPGDWASWPKSYVDEWLTLDISQDQLDVLEEVFEQIHAARQSIKHRDGVAAVNIIDPDGNSM